MLGVGSGVGSGLGISSCPGGLSLLMLLSVESELEDPQAERARQTALVSDSCLKTGRGVGVWLVRRPRSVLRYIENIKLGKNKVAMLNSTTKRYYANKINMTRVLQMIMNCINFTCIVNKELKPVRIFIHRCF